MKLGFFLNAYRNFPIEYALKSVAGQGYKGVELWAKGNHITPYDSEKRWDEIRQLTAKLRLEVYGISAHLDFVAPEEEKRKENINKFLGCIRMAKFFNVPAVHTASGGLYPEYQVPFSRQEDYFYEAMEIIGEEARRRNIIVALEAEPEKWLSKPEQVLKAIDCLGDDAFRVLVDIGHCFGIGEEVESYIEKVHPVRSDSEELDKRDILTGKPVISRTSNGVNGLLHLLHIDDVNRSDFPHHHLIPGEGDIDFSKLFDYLTKRKYDGWLSVELNKHNDYPKLAGARAKKFIDNLLGIKEKESCIVEPLLV